MRRNSYSEQVKPNASLLLVALAVFGAIFMLVLINVQRAAAAGFTVTQLTTNSYDESSPKVSGNNVVWDANGDVFRYDGSAVNQLNSYWSLRPQVSGNNVAWDNGDEIFLYNGSTVTQLTSNSYWDTNPQISGTNVVWQGYDGNDQGIIFYNGSTATTLTSNSEDDVGPRIDGNNVVWMGFDGNDFEIFYYNGSSTTQLTSNGYDDGSDGAPHVSGNHIVWEGNGEIFFYNGSSTTQLTNNSRLDERPRVDGNNVVWEAYDGNDWEIFLYNGSTITQLTNNDYGDRSPEVSGTNVVWQGNEGSNDFEIFYYNGSSTTQLTSNGYDDVGPRIDGNNVVWRGHDGNDWEIFLAQSAQEPPTDPNGGTDPNNTVAIDTQKPIARMVTPFVSTRISKTTTFKVKWSATDAAPPSGIKSYTVRYRPSTSRTWRTWKANTTSTYGYFKGKAGVTYYFRTVPTDNAGNKDWSKVYKTIVPFNEGIFLRKTGFFGYKKLGKSQNYLTSVRYSYKRGHTIVYKLYKTDGIGLVVTKGPKMGRAKIYVDGKYVRTVDAKSSKLRPRQLIFYRNLKKKGTHYLKVVNLGTPGRAKFEVDAVVVKR